MYDELINKLYHCANEVFCNKCPYSPDCAGEKAIIREAADAIEKLDAIAQTYVETVHEIEDRRKWIPVTERLPDESGRYLIVDSGHVTEAYYGKEWAGDNWTDPVEMYMAFHPTHWMPLPQPPESEGK